MRSGVLGLFILPALLALSACYGARSYPDEIEKYVPFIENAAIEGGIKNFRVEVADVCEIFEPEDITENIGKFGDADVHMSGESRGLVYIITIMRPGLFRSLMVLMVGTKCSAFVEDHHL